MPFIVLPRYSVCISWKFRNTLISLPIVTTLDLPLFLSSTHLFTTDQPGWSFKMQIWFLLYLLYQPLFPCFPIVFIRTQIFHLAWFNSACLSSLNSCHGPQAFCATDTPTFFQFLDYIVVPLATGPFQGLPPLPGRLFLSSSPTSAML